MKTALKFAAALGGLTAAAYGSAQMASEAQARRGALRESYQAAVAGNTSAGAPIQQEGLEGVGYALAGAALLLTAFRGNKA
jgi:hypothetical protein